MRRKLMEIVSVGRNSAGEVLKLTALKAGQLLKELEPAIYSSGSQLTTTDWQENLTLEASETRETKEINVSAGGASVPLSSANVVASAAISSVSASYGARWPGVTTFLSRGFHTTSANWDSRDATSEESGVLFDVDNDTDVEIGDRAVTSYRATDVRNTFITGTNDFRELRFSDEYVDKSEIVYAFEHSGSKVCANTFPRRFLKTTNLNTLEEFYRIEVDEMGIPLPLEARQNPALFAGGEVVVDGTARLLEPLKIAAHPEIMGKLGTVPVISLDLKGVSGDSYENALVTMKAAMHFAWDKHDYLANSDKLKLDQLELVARYTDSIGYEDLTESQVKMGLVMLSKLLHTHFGAQAIVLVDEYDTAINSAYRNLKIDPDDADRVIGLHRDMLGNVLKGNEHLYKGLVTGILRIAKANIFSGLNNLGEYSMGDRKFAGLYGFTQEEFDELVVRFGIPSALAADLKDWYNGYDVLGSEIYNPWSVVKALDSFNACRHVVDIDRVRKEVLQNYWQESGAFNFITPLFRHPDVKDAFTELAAGRTIEFEITKQISVDNFMALREMLGSTSTYEMTPLGKDILYSYLFAAGYLTPNGREGYYRAPNKEAMDEFTKQLVTYHKVKYKLGTPLFNKLTDQLQLILDVTEGGDYEEEMSGVNTALVNILEAMPDFKKIDKHEIEPVSDGTTIVHDNESLVQVIIGHASLQVRSATQFGTEVYVGKGRADCLIIDDKRKKAIIIELKYGKDSAGEAIVQIAEKEYGRPIPPDYEIINIGLSVGYDKSVTSELDITPSSILLASGIEASLLSTDHTDYTETENVTVTGDHGD